MENEEFDYVQILKEFSELANIILVSAMGLSVEVGLPGSSNWEKAKVPDRVKLLTVFAGALAIAEIENKKPEFLTILVEFMHSACEVNCAGAKWLKLNTLDKTENETWADILE